VKGYDLVGKLDELDYYSFNLAQTKRISATLKGLELSRSASITLYRASNNNGVIERINSSIGNFDKTAIISENLVAGSYVIQVTYNTNGGNTRYELTLSPS